MSVVLDVNLACQWLSLAKVSMPCWTKGNLCLLEGEHGSVLALSA